MDFHDPATNDWLVVNQYTVEGPKQTRRPDVVVFVNGMPLAVIELKNPADENADIWHAHQQLQTYKSDIPDLFTFNEVLGISDFTLARELTDYLRKNQTIDWAVRESVRARMRGRIKLILKKHHYPPDMEQRAVDLVLKQVEALAEEWVT